MHAQFNYSWFYCCVWVENGGSLMSILRRHTLVHGIEASVLSVSM